MDMKKITFIVFAVFAIFGTATATQAIQINTAAEGTVVYSGTNPATYNLSDTHSGTSGTVESSVFFDEPTGGVGFSAEWHDGQASASGNEAGVSAVRARYESANSDYTYNFKGRVSLTQSFTAATSGDYYWDFTIDNGQLSISDWSNGSSMTAYYTMGFSSGLNLIWNSSATLAGGRAGYTYTEDGTDIGGILFGDDGSTIESTFGYRYNPYSGSIFLGSFNTGETIELSYAMEVGVAGPSLETGALAYFGDPGDLEYTPGISGDLRGPSSVPEPGTMLLLGLGLAGLAGMRRRFEK